MTATITVNKKNIKKLFSEEDKLFLIPEYQRPYSWDIEQVETLLDDLWEFSNSDRGGTKNNGSYFLGCIVYFKNDNNESEIIDGQQRITTLCLLLRAMYTYLCNADNESNIIKNFKSQIETTIWKKDNLTGDVKFDEILIKSAVMSDENNEKLRKILETGEVAENSKDAYSQNYTFILETIKRKAEKEALQIYDFFHSILNQAIVFPIEAVTQDDALKIFSTLNNRGLPLSDADIFKATIYKALPTNKRNDFVKEWRDIDEDATDVGVSIQQLFYYYMFYLRAKEGDAASTTPGLKQYYMESKAKRLSYEMLDDFRILINLWKVINKRQKVDGEQWSEDHTILKLLDIISSYPNEFWKYPVVIFYLKHRLEDQFIELFTIFLQKLIYELLSKYLISPTINTVKGDIVKLNCSIYESSHPTFNFRSVNFEDIKNCIKTPHWKVVRMLLKILAYKKQNHLLPTDWHIEHILPRNYQPTFFKKDLSKEQIEEYIEHLGNKVPLEEKLNIVASDGYFDKKKKVYENSKIKIVKELVDYPQEWTIESIMERDIKNIETIKKIFNKRNNDYIK